MAKRDLSISDGHELGAVFMLMRELFDPVTYLELPGNGEMRIDVLEGRPRSVRLEGGGERGRGREGREREEEGGIE